MNYAAISHRVSDIDCYMVNDDVVEINLKTGYDVDQVNLYHDDPFSGGIMGGNWAWQGECAAICSYKKLQYHKLWTIQLRPPFKRLKYYFEIISGEEHTLLFEDGFFAPSIMEQGGKRLQCFTMPWMNKNDVARVPQWVNETIWYQIFPDRFRNGDLSIDASYAKPWGEQRPSHGDFYSGDLQGIINKLDYLENLGITGIYLNPVFKAPSNHKYDTEDYFTIDPLFGSKETLKELVEKAHQKGIRIMLDAVFNHCGERFAPWLDVLKKGHDSEYFDWFMINTWPFDQQDHSTKHGAFYSFAFTSQMPKLNTNNPEVMDYLCKVCEYWTKECDVDGWRMDVANEVSHDFCKVLRKRLHALKPDMYILGEIWHDAMPWLRGDEFDSVMNYPLTTAMDDFWEMRSQSKQVFEHQLNSCYHRYQRQHNDALFNLLDSHDTDRLIHRLHGDQDAFVQQMAMLFTMPGSPCIFYGSELMLDGSFDPDCRVCMPWEDIEKGVYEKEFTILQQLIALRKSHVAFRIQDMAFLDEYEEERMVVYEKYSDQQTVRITLNATQAAKAMQPENILFMYGFEHGELKAGGVMIEMRNVSPDNKK